MIRTKALAACFVATCFVAAVFVGSGANPAAAEPEAPPPPPVPIDWRDYVDDMDEGDHVVGEELCAAPESVGVDPGLFVFI